MSIIVAEIVIVLLLILANGVFAMAEFAIEVSRHVPDWPSALRGRVTEIMELP